ncbi:DoxX family protein [Flavobacterium selenitireducens]|uniref:DoxX family protein n=1 Tax=Flavobacterium selenitireducens TaxID=2722704 RepID=UPI00168AE8F0|nr:DoxX family protein [Flavobacterium selenitireducens]MBD3581447.1 DoxX family protein [Flavobacterium selenitireducens]
MTHYNYAYFAARLPIGFSFFGHGLVRLPKMEDFAGWMVSAMENSMLPAEIVRPFAYVLPIAELLIGLLVLAGLFTRQALFAGIMTMSLLVFGSTTIEDWGAITGQLFHAAYFAVLLWLVPYNSVALDKLRQQSTDY